jgi:large subunit ribosomal protein L4
MPKLALYNRTGSQVGEINLNESVFGVEVNGPVVHRAIVAQLAAMRAGTHKTKTRGEVSGGGKKPWRQKGTGRARQGSTRAPHWVGGGNAFGPSPRDYTQKINKKEKRLAVRSALSNKVEEGKLFVIDGFNFTEPKTKEMIKVLTDLKLIDQKVLILLPGNDEAVYKSARNLPRVKTLVIQALNTYDLVNYDYIVTTKDAVAAIEEVLM